MSLIRKYLEEKACKSKVAEAKEKDDSKDDGTGTDEVETSDYKIDKHGKKYRAHKIVFNKGEEDGKGFGEETEMEEELKGSQHKLDKNKNGKLDADDFKKLRKEEMTDDQMKKREDYVKGMKKNYSSFVDKYGKDRAKSVMYATATKMAMKEETAEEQLEENWNKGSSSSNHSDRTKALQYKAKAEQKLKAAKLVGKDHPSYNTHMSDYHSAMAKHVKHAYHAAQYGSQSDAKKAHDSHTEKAKEYKSGISEGVLDTVKKVAKKVVDTVGHKDDSELLKDLKKKSGVKEGWEDMLKASKERAAASASKTKTSTKTYHDVKKTSTGTVYTKQHDKDGISKGTGEPAPDQKRGRGRPKKDKFAEAVEFLMDLTEEQFDQVVEEGLDSFVESFLDESAKGYQPGWMIKASPELKAKIDAIKAKHAAMRKAMGNPAAGKSVGK